MINPSDETQVLADLSDFLRSSATNVEWLSDRLRVALNVPTGLEAVMQAVIAEGRSVVVAGTAGSGKTHLLRSIGVPTDYSVVNDLAALPETKWTTLLNPEQKVIVAGNEGAFLRGKYKGFVGFADVIDLLHAIQRGEIPRDRGPTVIDAAGFDPAGSQVISQILQLSLLRTYVKAKAPPLASNAWDMLQNPDIARRVAALIELASAESEGDGFTFRQLWQFVADIIEGGINRNEPWFSRMFIGGGEVASRIALTFSPSILALPHIGNRLWHGDIGRLRGAFLDCAMPVLEQIVPLIARETQAQSRLQLFDSLRLLAAFSLRDSPLDNLLNRGIDLWSRVRQRETLPLLQAINRYFAFGLIEFGDDLELWLQHDTERRLIKPDVQISLGAARADDFRIKRSNVVANPPKGVQQVEGSRLLLTHLQSGAVLSVTKDLVDGILHGRSHRTAARRGVEYDWRIARFLEQIASKEARPDRLKAAHFNFQARTGRLVAWQVGADRIRKVAAA
jgi:hypothetical protein